QLDLTGSVDLVTESCHIQRHAFDRLHQQIVKVAIIHNLAEHLGCGAVYLLQIKIHVEQCRRRCVPAVSARKFKVVAIVQRLSGLHVNALRFSQNHMNRSLNRLQVLKMQLLVEEISQTAYEPSIHFVEIILGDSIANFRKVQFLADEVLNPLDDSTVQNVQRLRRKRLHFVELVGKCE